jgi:hypothetical protein
MRIGAGVMAPGMTSGTSIPGDEMTVDERARHQLFVRLEEVIGPDEATTLMEHLPPGGYTELATKQDLENLKNELLAKIGQGTRTIVFALVAVVVSISSVALFR